MKNFIKKILAAGVAIIIWSIAAVVSFLLKGILGTSLGESAYDSFGTVGIYALNFIYVLPLIIAIWLIRISWKIITTEKDDTHENK